MNSNLRYKTCRSALRHFVTIAGSSLLAFSSASAADYYWDTNGDGTAGFGSATGTWSSAGTGNTWSTSPTGDGVGGAAVADYITTTSDDLYFGTPAISTSGTVTIDGVVNANSVFDGAISWAGTTPTINFAAEGTYTRGNNNNGNLPVMTFTGNGTSLTWQPQRNLSVANVDTTTAGKIILQTSPTSTFPYPGRTAMDKSANLGAANAPLVFDDGCLRLLGDFPYDTLSDLHTDHPVDFVDDKDFGLETLSTTSPTFTIDLAVDAGTGVFWAQGNRPIILTQANTWGGVKIASGILQISDSSQLGPIGSYIQFGSGFTDLSGGTLIIAGTTMTDFGARPFLTTPGKDVGFEIVETAHTFTLDSVLDMTTGKLTKSGDGTLALSGAANTYTGVTTVAGGTLALVGGSHASPITVSSGASLGFTIGSGTTSTSSVNLTNGDVTISNPGAVDGSTSYLLMTAAGGFTFTDIATQLGTVVTGYALELQVINTELWLVPSGTTYDSWSGSAAADGDENGDGVENAVAYALGAADVNEDATALLPTSVDDGTYLIFTFNRSDEAEADSTTAISVEYGSDLIGWTTAVDDATNVIIAETGSAPTNVEVKLLKSTLGAAGKLFARLRVVVTP